MPEVTLNRRRNNQDTVVMATLPTQGRESKRHAV